MKNYRYDSELAAIAVQLPPSSWDDLVVARADYEKRVRTLSPNVDVSEVIVSEHRIATFHAEPNNHDSINHRPNKNEQEFSLRVYKPKNLSGLAPALLQIHGGGFVIGSLETEHSSAARNAIALDAVVVSVDYRLAPENPYPAGLYDCYAALRWMHDNAKELNIDPQRIAVHGTSAGGGLAAGLCLFLRDRQREFGDEPKICFQCLQIPELDDRLQTPSMTQFVDTPIWDLAKAKQSWSFYLGTAYSRGGESVPPTAAPARATDLKGLPPAYISTMEFDPLRDEGILYALALMQSGIPVELHSYPGTFHGSTMFKSSVSKRHIDESISVLKKALANS